MCREIKHNINKKRSYLIWQYSQNDLSNFDLSPILKHPFTDTLRDAHKLGMPSNNYSFPSLKIRHEIVKYRIIVFLKMFIYYAGNKIMYFLWCLIMFIFFIIISGYNFRKWLNKIPFLSRGFYMHKCLKFKKLRMSG